MYTLAVANASAGANQIALQFASDCVLVGATPSGQAILTTDPSATYAGVVTTPTVTGTDRSTIFPVFAVNPAQLKIPLYASEKYYLAFKAQGVIFLFIDDGQ